MSRKRLYRPRILYGDRVPLCQDSLCSRTSCIAHPACTFLSNSKLCLHILCSQPELGGRELRSTRRIILSGYTVLSGMDNWSALETSNKGLLIWD